MDLGENENTSQQRQAPKPRLSCVKCTQRKVKCDKGLPCSNCQRAGIPCVPIERQRLPRGRHRGAVAVASQHAKERENELQDRLARLESLVKDLVASASLGNTTNDWANSDTATSSSPQEDIVQDRTTVPKYREVHGSPSDIPASSMKIGNQFWLDLVAEVS
jgi:hypothetical protein